MWIETDHHGLVNLNHVKRIDLAGDIEKKTLGIYLFDEEGNTYPIIDIPRFTHIGILKETEKDQDIQMAVYCFYSITKKLLSTTEETKVITIEAIYKDFAAEWYAQRHKEPIKKSQESGVQRQKKTKGADKPLETGILTNSHSIHHFSDPNRFLDRYANEYSKKFKKPLIFNHSRDKQIAAELVSHFTMEKLQTMLHGYFESHDDFIVRSNYSILAFKTYLESTDLNDFP